MMQMPLERKRYLLKQNKQRPSNVRPPPSPGYSASYGPSSATTLLPKLVPQLTGGDPSSLIKRFSITGIAGWGGGIPGPAPPVLTPTVEQTPEPEPEPPVPEAAPLVPQTTGGLWGWWAGGSKEDEKKREERNKAKTPAWYAEGIRAAKPAETKLAKHLISLRVHLSTAKLAWIEKFVKEEKGMEELGVHLADLVGKGSKR